MNLTFDSIHNARDLGGLKTADGRTIRSGVLLRSGNPGLASVSDRTKLKALQLDLVLDFRSEDEKKSEEAAFAETFTWQANPVKAGELSPRDIVPLLKRSSPSEMRDYMISLYASFPVIFQEQFSLFLRCAERGKAMLYHCSAGKDRTGFASALLLSALGTSRSVIMQDYLLSNIHFASAKDFIVKQLQTISISKEVASPMLDVDEAYLEAAYAVIESRYGGMETYLTDILRIDAEKIRRHYLPEA